MSDVETDSKGFGYMSFRTHDIISKLSAAWGWVRRNYERFLSSFAGVAIGVGLTFYLQPNLSGVGILIFVVAGSSFLFGVFVRIAFQIQGANVRRLPIAGTVYVPAGVDPATVEPTYHKLVQKEITLDEALTLAKKVPVVKNIGGGYYETI